jgi:hypothetical protein
MPDSITLTKEANGKVKIDGLYPFVHYVEGNLNVFPDDDEDIIYVTTQLRSARDKQSRIQLPIVEISGRPSDDKDAVTAWLITNFFFKTSTGGGGGGDMSKSTYDTTDNGIVDDSEALGGQSSAYHLNRANHLGTQLSSTISDFDLSVSGNSSVSTNTTKVSARDYIETNSTILTTSVGAWVQRTLTGDANKTVNIRVHNISNGTRTIGVRTESSTNALEYLLAKDCANNILVKVDGSEFIRIYSDGTDVIFTKIGEY